MITENDVILIPGICTARHALIYSWEKKSEKQKKCTEEHKNVACEMQIDSANKMTDYKK